MIKWRKIVTYRAVYVNPKTGNTITIHALNPLPKFRAFRGAGGNRKFKRTQYTATRRVVLIMAKSRKKGRSTKDDVVDDELDELEELEDLDDLEDEEDDDEDEDDEPEDEDEDEDDDDEDDDEEGLADMTVKELRAKAREDGHAASAIKGLKKDELVELIEEGVEEDEEDEDDEDDEEEETPPKRSRSNKKSGSSKKTNKKASRSRTTDGKVGTQELADHLGIEPRSLRMVLRRLKIEKDDETSRYEWSSLNHPVVKKIAKAVAGGAVKREQKKSLDKLKGRKKSAGAKRSKSSGTSSTTKKKRRRRSA